jgi:hypothetical protein
MYSLLRPPCMIFIFEIALGIKLDKEMLNKLDTARTRIHAGT